MRKTFVVGLVVSTEPPELIRRAIGSVEKIYGNSLEKIIIVRKCSRDLDLKRFKTSIEIVDSLNNDLPQFLNMQKIYFRFLEGRGSHLITLDPDTIVLGWDGEFHELAGQFIYYRDHVIQKRLSLMPQEIQYHFREVRASGCVHAIQGGWSMRSREICERMVPYFYTNEDFQWNSEQWPAHELYLGFYLKMAGIQSLGGYSEVRESQKEKKGIKYSTQIKLDKIKKVSDKTNVVHPIKNSYDFDRLIEKIPLEEIRSFLLDL